MSASKVPLRRISAGTAMLASSKAAARSALRRPAPERRAAAAARSVAQAAMQSQKAQNRPISATAVRDSSINPLLRPAGRYRRRGARHGCGP